MDRVEVFSIIEQILSIINRPHVKKALEKNLIKINSKLDSQF